jgi:hypothetical protein
MTKVVKIVEVVEVKVATPKKVGAKKLAVKKTTPKKVGAKKATPKKEEGEIVLSTEVAKTDLPIEESPKEILPITILTGTWKDGIEAKSFEINVLQVLKVKFNCEVTQTKNPTKNIFEVSGTPEDVELLTIAFTELVTNIRLETRVAYKESTKEFSLFKFTTNYHTALLEVLPRTL